MPILHSLQQNKENLFFLDDHTVLTDENIMTIITGKNSVGKSRLLRSIIIDSLKNNKFEKVIAISNTQYHKFPSYRVVSDNNFRSDKYIRMTYEEYPYINRNIKNNESTKEPISVFLQDFLINNNIKIYPIQNNINFNILRKLDIFVRKSAKNKKSFWVLNEILDFLGLDSYLKCEIYKPHNNYSANNSDYLDKILEENIKLNKNLNEEELFYIIKLKDSLDCWKNLTSFYFFEINDYQLDCLGLLIDIGLIRIRRAHFSKKKDIFAYNDLSSGELAVLSLILGLSSELENNSIICIDEPELNLHPEWQEKIIKLIELVSKFYSGCHFFIATHSPQLISGINNNNTFILDLSKNRVFNIEKYKNRSSDFQLSEIFNFPGNNNEYLIRKILLILNKQNVENDYTLDYESKKLLINIDDLIKKNKLHDQDKVKILFELVEGFQG